MTPASGACSPCASCDPLVDVIRQQGPLSDLFLRAASTQLEAARQVLAEPCSRRAVVGLVDEARGRIEREAGESPLAVLRQCAPGCMACCHTVTTDCTPLEAIVLAQHLRAVCTPETLVEITARLASVADQRRRLDASQRATSRLRCGLLDDSGLCAGYAARPLACTGAMSFSRESCYRAWRDPQNTSATASLDHALKVWTMGISGGLQRALVEAGLDANLYELNSILARALQRPDALECWLRREDVFAGCQCTDAHSPPRKMPARPHSHMHASGPARPASLAKRGVRS